MNTTSTKIIEWLNSGEYIADIDEMRTNIMRDSISSNSESTTASIFERELYYLIRSKTDTKLNYSKEQAVNNIKHKFGSLKKRSSGNGRLDAVVNNLIIEYKHYSKLQSEEQIETACQQVVDYLIALYETEKFKYSAILTDGVKISYFVFVGDEIRFSALSPISVEDIDNLIKAILSNNKKRFVPTNIIKDFSISPSVDSVSKSIALVLYNCLKKLSDG